MRPYFPGVGVAISALCFTRLTGCQPETTIDLGGNSAAQTGAATETGAETGTDPDSSADSAEDTGDTANAAEDVFTLIAVPDTQFLAAGWPDVFDETFAWIADHAEELNLAFVLGEGDVVQDDSPEEWAVAERAWRRLDGVVPYAVAVGNHDLTGDDSTRYNNAFPRTVQAALPGFGGTREADRMDDAWHTFRAGGVDWLVLSLSWTQSSAQLVWAAEIVAAHPQHRVIVTTHAYLQPSGSLAGQGELIWSEVLESAANATIIVNGHYTSPDAAHQIQMGGAGQEVTALFANYQSDEGGGMGRIRIMQVDVGAGTLRVQSYAPAFDAWLDDDENEFTLGGLEFGAL